MNYYKEGYEIEENNVESDWENGYHTTIGGDVINIEDITTRHLINIINLFRKDFNVGILIRELDSRDDKLTKRIWK